MVRVHWRLSGRWQVPDSLLGQDRTIQLSKKPSSFINNVSSFSDSSSLRSFALRKNVNSRSADSKVLVFYKAIPALQAFKVFKDISSVDSLVATEPLDSGVLVDTVVWVSWGTAAVCRTR